MVMGMVMGMVMALTRIRRVIMTTTIGIHSSFIMYLGKIPLYNNTILIGMKK